MEPRVNSTKNSPAPISPLFTHQLQQSYKTRALRIRLQTCERGEGGFGVCSTRSALGSYFHMHCLPGTQIPMPPGIDCLLSSCLPWSHFRVHLPTCWTHLIFDNVANPTAALSWDLRSANTNSTRPLLLVVIFQAAVPKF